MVVYLLPHIELPSYTNFTNSCALFQIGSPEYILFCYLLRHQVFCVKDSYIYLAIFVTLSLLQGPNSTSVPRLLYYKLPPVDWGSTK
jgi:hypothetical protein